MNAQCEIHRFADRNVHCRVGVNKGHMNMGVAKLEFQSEDPKYFEDHSA